MRQMARVTMSMRELDRLKCVQAVIDSELPAIRAAERLAMSTRQIRRLAQRYRLEGPVGLISRARNQTGNRRLEADLETEVTRILRERYADFGPTLVAEKLAERHQIVLANETVRRIQVQAGLWIPRKLRAPKIQQPQARRGWVGELIQIGSLRVRDHPTPADRRRTADSAQAVATPPSNLLTVTTLQTPRTETMSNLKS